MNAFWTVLYVAAFFVVPIGLGMLLCLSLRVKDFTFKWSLVLFTIGIGFAPFINQIVQGHSPWDAIHQGIDLAGGTNLIYQVAEKEGEPITDDLMNRMVGAVQRRINPAGTKEVVVRRIGRDRIEVIIPGANPAAVEEIKDLMTRLGSLEFSIVANQRNHKSIIDLAQKSPAKDVRLDGTVVAAWREIAIKKGKGGKEVPAASFGPDSEVAVRPIAGKKDHEEVLVIVEPNEANRITGKLLSRANVTNDNNGSPAVGFHFNSTGAFLFRELTQANKPLKDGFRRHLAILLDDKIESAPVVEDVIGADGIIRGNFSLDEVEKLVSILNAGALPTELKKDPISEFTISPTLGFDVQSKGKLALWVSTLAVVLFMGVYYIVAGAVADFAMVLNLLFIVSTMAFIDAAFTLPGLAGLVLSAGMAVDANVLIYERIREETQRGASLRMAIHNGFDKAFSAIFDSNVTTLITAVILYTIGTDQVKGFAVSLTIGLVMNLFTAVYVSRLVLETMERSRLVKRLNMLRVIGETKLDFVGKQTLAISASAVLIVAGLIAVAARGKDNLDIDFTGGTMVSMQFTQPQQTDEVRNKLEEKLGSNITLEELSRAGGEKGKLFRLRTTEQNEAKVEEQVSQAFPGLLVRVEMKPGEIKPIAGAPPAPEKGKENEKAPEAVDTGDRTFAGGHEVPLAFTQEIAPTTVKRYITHELEQLKLNKAESLVALEGTSGSGVTAKEGQARQYDKMVLRATKDVPDKDLQTALAVVQAKMQNKPSFEEVTSFESSVADEAIRDATVAILASFVAIVIYVWFRFERVVFGLAAVLALVHDVLVSLGCVALGAYLSRTPLGPLLMLNDFKINMPMIAAFLTIVGYSINDTIVIFDRLREVRGKNPVVNADMINLTVNQTLSRTLLTAFTVFISVLILYALGGEGIHGFAYCMLIGSIAGTYSTVYIASPLVLWFMKRWQPVANRRPLPPMPGAKPAAA